MKKRRIPAVGLTIPRIPLTRSSPPMSMLQSEHHLPAVPDVQTRTTRYCSCYISGSMSWLTINTTTSPGNLFFMRRGRVHIFPSLCRQLDVVFQHLASCLAWFPNFLILWVTLPFSTHTKVSGCSGSLVVVRSFLCCRCLLPWDCRRRSP